MAWREQTCVATPAEPNSMHVAAWPWAVRRHLRGRDIGSGIAAGRKFVKPPDRRSAHEDAMATAPSDASSPRLLRRFKVSPMTSPLDAGEAGAIGQVQPGVDRHGPDEVWCADRRTRPTEAHRAHGATNLLVRTRNQIDGSSSAGSSPAPLREQIGEWSRPDEPGRREIGV